MRYSHAEEVSGEANRSYEDGGDGDGIASAEH
jgi:hypothetical protein